MIQREPSPDDVGPDADALPPPPKPIPGLERISGERRGPPAGGEVPVVAGYEIVSELGRGGMGVVYLARQVALDRLVALKMILAGRHATAEDLLRFRAEAGAAARLQHPNIVQVYEVGRHAGQPYFALEYVPGGNLAARTAGTRRPPREAAGLVETLARAVHYAHERGVVHRDLKPGNVLLTSDGVPKIADFGLARLAGPDNPTDWVVRTQTGAVLGTPSYMAPEQALGRGDQIGPPADIYALGAILYELLTGRPPFTGVTPLETLRRVAEREPVPPSRLHRPAGGDLETICLKCLRKEPPKRYLGAAELADDLRRFLAGESIRARPAGRAERLLRWSRRNPRVAGLLGLLVVVFAVGFAGVFQQWRRAERQRAETAAHYQLARGVVADYFAILGTDPLLDHPGALPLRQDLLETALAHFQDARLHQEGDLELQVNLGRAWYCLGRLRAYSGPELEAVGPYQRAIDIQRRLADAHADRPEFRRDLARTYDALGRVETVRVRFGPAREAFDRALDIRERLHREDASDPVRRADLAMTWAGFGFMLYQAGERADGLARLREARRVLDELVGDHPANIEYQAALSGALNNLGLALHGERDFQGALALFDAAIKRQTPVFAQARHAAQYRHLLSVHHFNKAYYALLELDRPADAAEAARKARRFSPEDPHNLWRVARALARASDHIGTRPGTEDQRLRRQWADEALDALVEAVGCGLETGGWLRNPDLQSLANRPDFQHLRAEFEQKRENVRE